MPSEDAIAVAAQLSLIQSVDDRRAPDDPHKLPAWLRRQVDKDLVALELSDSGAVFSGVEQSGRSAAVRNILDQLEGLLRDGYNGIAAIRSTLISEDDRATVFAAYGWSGGLLGRFDADRIVGLARLSIREHAEVAAPYRYAPELITDLKAALAEYNRLVPEKHEAAQVSGVQVRNTKLEAAEQTLSQVRYGYYMASRHTRQNPELLKIGFRPRRPARTKEEIEADKRRAEEKRQERNAKRLQKINEREQREIQRLTAELGQVRANADRDREQVSHLLRGPEAAEEATTARQETTLPSAETASTQLPASASASRSDDEVPLSA